MNLGQYFKEARSTIRGNPLRSFLSILGIVIGIVSVVVMLGIGKGAEKKLMDTLGDFAKNQLQIMNSPREGQKNLTMTIDTITYIGRVFPELDQKLSFSSTHMVPLPIKTAWGGNEALNIFGVPSNWFKNNDKELLHGSFFTSGQYEKAESVIVITDRVYQYYLKGKNPIGATLTLEGKTFIVVGVVKNAPSESMGGETYDAWIPYSTFAAKFPNESRLHYFTIYLEPTADTKVWQKRISYALMKYYNVNHISALSFQIESLAKYVDQMKEQQRMMNYLLLAIGSISLLVGGIGVMNIMLVSVTERTKEIGIRKAVGALKLDIILQFLVESLLITLLGGMVAVILSYGIEYLVNTYGAALDLYSMITPEIVGLALIITSLTGIIFGILPARRAAKMNPIDALRYE